MDHQNWDVIYIRGNKELNKGKKEKEKEKEKATGDKKSSFLKENKMEKKIEEGNLKHDKVKLDISKTIQQKRLELGMTQKDLANKLNIPVKTIIDIESGKANKNQQLISKIKRNLNISNK